MLTDTADIEIDYVDATPALSATLTAAVHASLALADSAVQPGDNVSDLVNDAGYLTTAVLSVVPGTNITVDNTDPENPIINATGVGSGTVTSVDVIGGVGLDASGGPVTTSGAITLDLDAATQASLALADTSTQPGDNVSTLTNDAGYVTSSGVTSVSGTAPIVSSGGATPAISITAATSGAAGSMSAADKTKLDAISGTNTGDQTLAGLGGVPTTRTISTTAPLTGGGDLSANRTLAISAASGSSAGSMSSADFTKLAGIASGATANTGTVTSVALSVPTGLSVAGTPITTSGTFTVTYAAGYQGYTSAEATKLSGIATGATAYTDSLARSAVVIDSIADSDTTHAPSRNAVFDALALKQDASTVQSLAKGGTGSALVDPNADRLMFWDDSAGVVDWLTLGTNLSITGTTINASGGGGSGTVTSVDLTSTTGLTASGGPVTTSGSLVYTLSANLQAWHALSTSAKQDASADLTTIAGLSPTNDDIIQRKAGAWTNRTMAQLKSDLSLSKSDVGLSNVDNTADTAKPVSTLQAAADAAVQAYAIQRANHTGTQTMSTISDLPVLAYGTYTPTLFNTTNIAASTAFACQWLRVGDTVTVSGQVNIDPTAAAASVLGMSLPIASNFGGTQNLGGTATVAGTGAAVPSISSAILADPTNDRAQFLWLQNADLTNRSWAFQFTYRII
jgi:hypothetical protein